eukprot:322316_1
MIMETEEEEEDDDPTSSNHVISDDILFLCFEWLFAAELSCCMVVNKHWNEAAKDNHLWKLQCAMCFKRISNKNLSNKYSNSYYLYFQKHNKLRFDGIYILKVLYYIQSEARMPNFNTNIQNIRPYTTIEYYRYLRFFNNKCKIINEKITNDQSFNALYALSKKKPTNYGLINVFNPLHITHQNIKKKSQVIASLHDKIDGISSQEKVYKAKYDFADKKNVKLMVNTDYGLRLELGLSYYEVINGASDRLKIEYFDGISLNAKGEPIQSTRDHYEIRHEPFCFIPDARFKLIDQYFD